MTALWARAGRGAAGEGRTAAMRASLVPVARGLLEDARRRADLTRAAAEDEARHVVAAARAEAEQVVAVARREGEAAAARAAASAIAEARRAARSVVLAARRRAVEAVRHAALEELRRRRGTPEAAALAALLSALASARLGDGAVVRPDEDGIGIIAEAGGRRIALTAAALVDLHLGSLAAALEELWA